MNDNVIILGAGFSYDAGIPLLSGFLEKMWEYHTRGKNKDVQLSENDKSILEKALNIRYELDNYHGRVSFDDRNIEDVLSMLAFNVLGGTLKDKNKFEDFKNAISKTIELSCNIKHPGYPSNNQPFYLNTEGHEIYRRFWKAIFNDYKKTRKIPTIITFNYDLVLERALFQILISTYYERYENNIPFQGISLNYNYKNFPPQYFEVEYTSYRSGFGERDKSGIRIKKLEKPNENFLEINILKLHGSLNFPKKDIKNTNINLSLTNIIDNPYIIPPVSNKQSNGAGDNIWKAALNKLREAKNITFVGYSLPKTDMYMQFFLKAALGPNKELNKVFVFDPLLWKNNTQSKEMKERYASCFSEQFRNRISFNPKSSLDYFTESSYGTTEHFVRLLEDMPNEILF